MFSCFISIGKQEKAVRYLEKAQKEAERLYGEISEENAKCYLFAAQHFKEEEYTVMFQKSLQKILEIFRRLEDYEHLESIAIKLGDEGYDALKQKEYKKQLNYWKKLLNIAR